MPTLKPAGFAACVYVKALIREAGEQGVRGGLVPLRSELRSPLAFLKCVDRIVGRSCPWRPPSNPGARKGNHMRVFLSPVRFFSPLNHYFAKWRRAQIRRRRKLCCNCEACGRAVDASTFQLLEMGHNRAAVGEARLLLEMAVANVSDSFKYEGCRTIRARLGFLRDFEVITLNQFNVATSAYKRASKVIHGQGRKCLRPRAAALIGDLRRSVKLVNIAQIEFVAKPVNVIKGFAPAAKQEEREIVVSGFALPTLSGGAV